MHTVVADSDHSGKQIVNADLTLIPPASLHPDVLSREVSVLDALADVDTSTVAPAVGDTLVWDGASWKPKAVNSKNWYREAFTVSTVPAALLVVHGLAVDVVSVTVIRRGSPNVVVTPTIHAIDVNTVEVLIDGGPTGTYEVLVMSEGGSGGGGVAPAGDYLPLTGGTVTGNITVTGGYLTAESDGYGLILGGGARLYKKSGAGVVLRESSGGQQPMIESNDGTGGRNILDTANILGSNIDVSWINSFNGSCTFRVSPSMVTCSMVTIGRTVVTPAGTQVEMFNYPSGVPAPFAQISCIGQIADAAQQADGLGICVVEFRPDGVFLRTWNTEMNNSNHKIYGVSVSWTR